jgi:hypothetical protein
MPAPDDIDARLRRIRMSKQVSYGVPATPPLASLLANEASSVSWPTSAASSSPAKQLFHKLMRSS